MAAASLIVAGGEKNGEVWSLQWSKHIWQHVETQNVNLQFCGNTKCHSGKLWKHKMSMMTLWTFCVSTKFHYAILCFHKMARWIFVETQTAQTLYLIRRVSEGGTLANFFSDHMEKQLSFSDQTWISYNRKVRNMSNSHHFFQHVRSWKSCQGLESSTHVPVLREISIIFWTSWPSSNLTHPLPQSPCFDSRCTVAAEELLSRSILAAHGLMLVTPKESSSRS